MLRIGEMRVTGHPANRDGVSYGRVLEIYQRSSFEKFRKLIDEVESDMKENPGRQYKISWESV